MVLICLTGCLVGEHWLNGPLEGGHIFFGERMQLIRSALRKLKYTSTLSIALMASLSSSAQAESYGVFFLQHWATSKFMHPYGGKAFDGVGVVLFDGANKGGMLNELSPVLL